MSGFEIFLCVLAGIILFFILILSIPVHVSFTYSDKIYLSVRYLFIKLDILPLGEKKEKKKKEKNPEEKKEEEPKTEEKPKEKGPNKILEMVKANGYDGMMLVLSNLLDVLKKWGGNIFRSVVFNEVEIYVNVGTGDAASTAIKYGKTCQKVYPFMGYLCANNTVKKYDAAVDVDFLANTTETEMNMDFYLVVRKIINATVAMAVRLVFKVLLKFLKGGKAKEQPNTQNTKEESTDTNNSQDKATA